MGDACYYAHTPEELRRPSEPDVTASAAHWKGFVSIGVVEQALLWDLPPYGTTDVVCNRGTCLGNPFATGVYDTPPESDSEGWVPKEHEDLCAAFGDYLGDLLERTSEEPLADMVCRIALARKVTIAETWMALSWERHDVLSALDTLSGRVAAGARLRLLCHCRPHVRCHAEALKAHLELSVTGSDSPRPEETEPRGLDIMGCVWPGFGDGAPMCAMRSRGWCCPREGRAQDPGNMQTYCAQCWSRHAINIRSEQACATW